MLKKTISVLLVIYLMTAGICVYGAGTGTASISYLPKNGEITVMGEVYGSVVITITPAELVPQNMSENALPTIFKQIDANGAYSCAIGMPYSAPGGKYAVYVSGPFGEISDSFVYMNVTASEQLIPELIIADGSDFDKLVLDNALTLGIDKEDDIFVTEQENILNMLDSMNFEDAVDFYTKYALVYAISAIEGEEKTENVKAVLAKYYAQLGIDYNNDFENESRLDSNAKDVLLELLSKIHYADKTDENGNIDFADLFNENKALAAVKGSKSWVTLKTAMTESFADDFENLFNNETYKKIRDKDKVFQEIMASSRSSLDVIKKEFLKITEEVYAAQDKSSANTSQGKGSTGGSVTTPAASSETKSENVILFSDVPMEHWAYNSINKLADKGVISGYEDGSFHPSDQITRAEFTKLIISFADTVESVETEKIVFNDVNDGDWFKDAVLSAANKGIVKGTGALFNPNNSITREDAALIIYRLMLSIDKKPLGYRPFADRNDISDYAKDSVYALGGAQIVQGSGDNMFLPKNNITRAEAAQLICNALQK